MASELDFISTNPTFTEDIIALLPEHMRNKTIISTIATLLLDPYKEMEELLVELANRYIFATSEGVFLDAYGVRYGAPRTTSDDQSYRTDILIKALGSLSHITRDNVVAVLKKVVDDDDLYIEQKQANVVRINIQNGGLTSANALDAIANMFPVNMSVSITTREGIPFGFVGNTAPSGFAQLSSVADEYPNGGRLCSVLLNAQR